MYNDYTIFPTRIKSKMQGCTLSSMWGLHYSSQDQFIRQLISVRIESARIERKALNINTLSLWAEQLKPQGVLGQ
jgi:hypothetical protein